MKKITLKLFTWFVLVTLLLVPTTAAYAQGPNPGNGGQVIFGRNFTLAKGETYDGDLVVFGGNVVIEDDAQLNGNLVVVGGTIKSNGETSGDVVVVGGQVDLQKAALVSGDVVTIGSQLTRAEGAKIHDQVKENGRLARHVWAQLESDRESRLTQFPWKDLRYRGVPREYRDARSPAD